MWYSGLDTVGQIRTTASGELNATTGFAERSSDYVTGIAAAPTGTLYFGGTNGVLGTASYFPPRGDATEGVDLKVLRRGGDKRLTALTVTPGGKLFFFASNQARTNLTSFDPASGRLRNFPLRLSPMNRGHLAYGTDGNLWYAATNRRGRATLIRMTPAGKFRRFVLGKYTLNGVFAGKERTLWLTFNSYGGRRIAKFEIPR